MKNRKKQLGAAVMAAVITATAAVNHVPARTLEEMETGVQTTSEVTGTEMTDNAAHETAEDESFRDNLQMETQKEEPPHNSDSEEEQNSEQKDGEETEAGINITEEYFTDETFRAYVKEKFDRNDDTVLQTEEISAVTEIDLDGNRSIRNLKGIEHFTELTKLNASGTAVENVNVSANTKLRELFCYSVPELRTLTLGNNTNLQVINCSDTGIAAIDLSGLPNLEYFSCGGTGLTELDIQSNTALKMLDCHNTAIGSLNVSKNTELSYLDCQNTQLAFLDFNDNEKLNTVLLSEQKKKVGVTGAEFDLTEVFPGINADKVTIEKNGVRDGNKVKAYEAGKPVVYMYDCGTSAFGDITLRVNVELSITNTWEKELSIENITYGESPVPSAEAAFGKVRYEYSSQETAGYGSSIPRSAGNYYVKAVVDSRLNYTALESAPKQFEIKQAENQWEEMLSVQDWVYGESEKRPSAESKFGKVRYEYSPQKDSGYTESIPKTAGVWNVRAVVDETADYTGLTSEPAEFEIRKGKAPDVNVPLDVKAVHGDKLSEITLPENWSWADPDQTVSMDEVEYRARLKVDDLNYDYGNVEGYEPAGHYVERSVSVSVAKASSSVILTGTIDKIYNGIAVAESELHVQVDGSSGNVVFLWEKKDNEGWTAISSAPVNAGEYRVRAYVTADGYYGEAFSEPLEFTVEKAAAGEVETPSGISAPQGESLKNVILPGGWTWLDPLRTVDEDGQRCKAYTDASDSNYDYSAIQGYDGTKGRIVREITVEISQWKNTFTKAPGIMGWTYGEPANEPYGEAKYGDVEFSYGKTPDGLFSKKIPETAGTWYLKAEVAESGDYTSLSAVLPFIIETAVPEYVQPRPVKASYGMTLQEIDLPDGFTWEDGSQSVGDAGTRTFDAVYTPEDTENYRPVNGIEVKVTVEKAQNKFTEKLTIAGWTEGDAPKSPNAVSGFGEVRYVYSDRADGNYIDLVPSKAGKWYVKAIVDETENYSGLESEAVAFTIKEAASGNGSEILRQGSDGEKTEDASGNGEQKEEKNTAAAKTGDISRAGLWASAAALAGGIAVAFSRKNRRERKKR